MQEILPIQNALISVYDKSGLQQLCDALGPSVRIYSTGGTQKHLRENCGVQVTPIESVTQFPEMMAGRVKTLHPRVFGGILARRNVENDIQEANKFEIPLFDLVVVNLYPFWESLQMAEEDQTALIDIGGPSMIRAAAKNHRSVTVLSHPGDYTAFASELKTNGGKTTLQFRKAQAAKTFQRTSQYDSMIASQWSEGDLPTSITLGNQTTLRYGENPHQVAAWSAPLKNPWVQHQGKELSYNNLLDTEAALGVTLEFEKPCVTIVKHNNPCGVAMGDETLRDVFVRALDGDPKSAFGGIVATNRPVDKTTAQAMSKIFFEVILAPEFDAEAKEIFAAKKNLRLIEWQNPNRSESIEIRRALGGWLVQQTDTLGWVAGQNRLAAGSEISVEKEADLSFAWLVCKHVKSNAIVLAKNGATLGIGAGQMSRVDAVKVALDKASEKDTHGAVLASDAFFPFRDNIDLLKGKGIGAIVQPGGSKRDAEVIEACQELGIKMVFTGSRHFRH